eukprot:7148854-Prymnesium_polylepis.1
MCIRDSCRGRRSCPNISGWSTAWCPTAILGGGCTMLGVSDCRRPMRRRGRGRAGGSTVQCGDVGRVDVLACGAAMAIGPWRVCGARGAHGAHGGHMGVTWASHGARVALTVHMVTKAPNLWPSR